MPLNYFVTKKCTCINGLIALGIAYNCRAPFDSRCVMWLLLCDGGPSSVVVVADDADDSRLP